VETKRMAPDSTLPSTRNALVRRASLRALLDKVLEDDEADSRGELQNSLIELEEIVARSSQKARWVSAVAASAFVLATLALADVLLVELGLPVPFRALSHPVLGQPYVIGAVVLGYALLFLSSMFARRRKTYYDLLRSVAEDRLRILAEITKLQAKHRTSSAPQ
jgi:hypothetical protein